VPASVQIASERCTANAVLLSYRTRYVFFSVVHERLEARRAGVKRPSARAISDESLAVAQRRADRRRRHPLREGVRRPTLELRTTTELVAVGAGTDQVIEAVAATPSDRD